MKEIVAILAIVGLLVFGAYMAASALDSAAFSFAEAQRHQAYATVTVAQIEAQTGIRMQELRMLENAYARSLFAVLFWPVAALVSLLLAGAVWFMVWRESRRPRRYGYDHRQLTGDWYPAIEAPRRYTHFELETLNMERDYWGSRRS